MSKKVSLPNSSPMPRLQDVALRAGVSTVAASKVLNNSNANTRVSEGTRRRILDAARELRYQPNAVARSLRRRKTNVIGVYLGHGFTDARNPFFSEIITGLQKGCERHGKDLLLHGTFRGGSVEQIFAEVASGKIDGLVLYGPPDDRLAQQLAASHLPTIAVADAIADLPSVVVDDAEGSRLLAQYLYQKGHRRILYRTDDRFYVSMTRRHRAFCESADALGMRVAEHCHVSAPEASGAGEDDLDCLRVCAEQGATAVVCVNDYRALRLLSTCRRSGVHVPDDVALVGFDNIYTLVEPALRLTTIHAPWIEVASTAISLLVARIQGETIPQETVIPVELVVGDTA